LSYFDIIPSFAILLFSLLCYQKGLLKSLLGLAVLGGALLLSVQLYPAMANWLSLNFSIEPLWLNPLAFAILFTGGLVFFYSIGLLIKRWVPNSVHTSPANKVLGLVPGLVAGWMVALVITKISAASTSASFSEQVEKSFFASSAKGSPNLMEGKLTAIFTPPIDEKISGAHEGIGNSVVGSEPFTTSNYVSRPDLEVTMLQLINAERVKQHLKPLKADEKMREAAALHAADMFVRGYFSHNSPEGIDPFMRMKKMGIKYKAAGENLAHAANLTLAHNGLMRSPGHRDNILSPAFGRVGIAILDAGTKGLMFAQEFRD